VWREREQWRELFWIPLPMLAWGVVGALIHGDPGWLPGAVLGSSRPLTSAGPIHYFRNLISVAGPAVFLGLFLGSLALIDGRSSRSAETPVAASRAPAFATLVFVTVFGLLTLLTWERLPFGGSIGFLRHLIVLAPAGALLAGFGYAWAFRAEGTWRILAGVLTLLVIALVALVLSHRLANDYFVIPGHDWSRLMGLAPVALLVLVAPWVGWLRRRAMTLVSLLAALFAIAVIQPIDLNVEQKVVKNAVDYLGTEHLLGRPMMANHPWVYFLTGRDRWDRAATPYVTAKSIEAARPGALAIWENHYGQRLYGDVPVEVFRQDPRWELIFEAESGDKQFRVVIFERK